MKRVIMSIIESSFQFQLSHRRSSMLVHLIAICILPEVCKGGLQILIFLKPMTLKKRMMREIMKMEKLMLMVKKMLMMKKMNQTLIW